MHSFKQVVVLPWGIKKLKPTKSFDRIKSFVQEVLRFNYRFHYQEPGIKVLTVYFTPFLFLDRIPYVDEILQAVDVMKEVNGNEYRVGCTHCLLYESSGISLDWAHGQVIIN